MDYYNDNDPHAVEWLRQLVRDGLIPFGDVDDRSIADVSAGDLEGYRRVHFFAGIGGWAYALELAKWPEDRPVWTGSCPCQPFSAAGKRKGTEDERHLWPEFARLIGERFPPTVFGEQVASKAGREWLSGVFADLEGMGYAGAGADLCAAGAGAPHIRQRLWWVADAVSAGRAERGALPGDGSLAGMRGASGLGHTDRTAQERQRLQRFQVESEQEAGRPGHANSWARYALIRCSDGKARRVEPGTSPLAHGVSGRVGLLRGYGNAIVPQVAAAFIEAYLEAKGDMRRRNE